MCPRKTGVKITEIKGYTISKYHEGKKPYVDFYAIDPTDKATQRKKYYITATTKKQGRMMAARLIDTLTIKLYPMGGMDYIAQYCVGHCRIFDCVIPFSHRQL